ncbi:hypothetical protein ACJJTC_016435 [Scirpophaga incertulas]
MPIPPPGFDAVPRVPPEGDRAGKSLADDSDLQDLEKDSSCCHQSPCSSSKGTLKRKNEVSEAKVGDTVTLVVSLEKPGQHRDAGAQLLRARRLGLGGAQVD